MPISNQFWAGYMYDMHLPLYINAVVSFFFSFASQNTTKTKPTKTNARPPSHLHTLPATIAVMVYRVYYRVLGARVHVHMYSKGRTEPKQYGYVHAPV